MGAPGCLAGVRVVELGSMVAAPYCGKLLADLGADVVKVEPPDGDPARRAGPFPADAVDPEASALFLYLNTSKRSVVVDLETPEGARELERLCAWADVLVDDLTAGALEAMGLGGDALRRKLPSLVHTSLTPYGHFGPRAGAPAGELSVIHAGGLGNLLPTRSSDVDRAPVKLGGYQAAYQGAIAAALGTVAALLGRRASGGGRRIDVSLQDVLLCLVAPNVTAHRYHGTTWSRVPDRPPSLGRLQTRDGYVILNAFDDHHFRKLRGLMGDPEWCRGPEWDSLAYRVHHLMDIAPQMEAWAATQDKHALFHAAAEQGIPIGSIETAADVLEREQLAARRYFVDVAHPRGGKLRYPGWPYQLAEAPARVSRPAPLLGAHTSEFARQLGTPAPASSTREPTEGGPPLSGIRVIELCWMWAGPYVGRLLASLGAEVIKIESHHRMDLGRRSVVWPLPEPEPTPLGPNQGMGFVSVNLGKKSLTLDLGKPEGKDVLRDLVRLSDVVVDNMRPGALDKLGLGHADLQQLRPDLVVASSSAHGRQGPESRYLGYAMVHQGLGGGAYVTGYPDEPPCHSGGDVDLMNAMALGYAIVAALYRRAETGQGERIDFSQTEGVTSLLGEMILGYQMTGKVPERTGNRHPAWAPHGVYRAWGVDRWIAIEVHDDAEFAALARVMGEPALTGDPRFSTAAARKANEDALDATIEAWTRKRDRDWLVARLLESGVRAAPSRDARDLYADPHLKARGSFVRVAHPELGDLDLVGTPWRMSETDVPTTCSPALGEHNRYVLGELLGLSAEQIDELARRDVIAVS